MNRAPLSFKVLWKRMKPIWEARKPPSMSTRSSMPVAGIRDRATGKINVAVVQDTTAGTLQQFVCDSILAPGSTRTCRGMPSVQHEAVSEYVNGMIHMVWSPSGPCSSVDTMACTIERKDIMAWQSGLEDVYLNPTRIHSSRLTVMQPASSPVAMCTATKGSIVSVTARSASDASVQIHWACACHAWGAPVLL